MTDSPLPDGDDHQVIRLGEEAAVIVPLEEYKEMRRGAAYYAQRRRSGDVIRMTAEEFIESAGLAEEDERRLLAKVAEARASRAAE